MRWLQRKPENFNLAFLDIMACGLGAIILIFMLVKYQTENPDIAVNAMRADLSIIQDEVKTIQSNNSKLAAKITALKQKLQAQIKDPAQQDKENSATVQALIELAKEIASMEKTLDEKQRTKLAQTAPKDKQKLNEEHLLGLRVTGKRILILLDNSASMADERLVDIIKIKISNTAAKKSAPKWQRAVSVAQWIIDRIPEDSMYMVVNYNDKADFLVDNKWLASSDANARSTVLEALGKLYPQTATNLHSALALIKTSAIRPTDIYVITDSLPTKGLSNLSTLQRFKDCGVATNKTTISGKCRNALFYSAIKSFSSVSAIVNTVLLPIEGDPDAPYAYWLWAASTTGTMVSPSGSWP